MRSRTVRKQGTEFGSVWRAGTTLRVAKLAPPSGQMIDARQAGIAKIERSKNPRPDGDHLYRNLLEGLPAAFYATDAEGYLTFYNQAAADLWGRRPKLGHGSMVRLLEAF